ncbi:hypothetical protein N3K66_008521 [Trichothecium roseum]|uniref:Uncharacterized protein n=1 Tax=Trichothecium roseum TaxID=47278 RepID=A0ACC0US41_9HYPO|nr:hypothetical protein N3K66_008521 [Trichothecium roseum]
MPSRLCVAALSMVLKLSANLVAQTVAIHKSPVPISVDWQRVLEFAMFGFIQGHINYWWQHFLDRRYPDMGGGGAAAASKPILPVASTCSWCVPTLPGNVALPVSWP